MSTYKITNTTNLIGKRELNYNSIVNVEYVENMGKLNKILQPGETMYMTISALPMSLHKLRSKGLINISEVNSKEAQEATKPRITITTTQKIQEKKTQKHQEEKKTQTQVIKKKDSKDEKSE